MDSSKLPHSTPSPNPNRVQESPIFSYISNLSPIKPDKAALVVQGFPEITSPPFIFRSCQGKPKGMKSSPERVDFSRSSEAAFVNVEEAGILVDKSVKSIKDLSSDSRSRPYKTLVTINHVQEKTSNASGNADHLSAIDNLDGAANEMLIIQSPPLVFEKDEDYDSSHSPSSVKTFESVKKSKHNAMPHDVCSKIDLNSSGDQFLDNQHEGDVGQRGINRRLQFDEYHSEKIATFSFHLSGRRAGYPRLTAGSAEAEVPECLSLYQPVSASNASIANVNQTLFCPQNDINYNIKVPKPSGIGLHLNSLIAKRRESALKLRGEGGSFDEPGVKSVCNTSCNLHKNEVGDASLSNNGNVCDTTTSIEASAAESSHDVKPLIVKLKIPPQSQTKRKCSSETVDSSGDSVQSNPKKERKIVMYTDDGNGCKRCNCRKTKCLKLYCDCFAAGIYCSEPCACQGCFNRPEYEYAVLKSRQLIESRDPLAFVPKVIQNWNGSLTNVCTDDGEITMFSGRHRRGCNCKKSKCLKKYCECYQANVGCSDGCRCEGCENPHGQKEVVKDWAGRQNHCRSLDPSFGVVPSKGNFVQNEPHTPQDMSPLTPPFQDSIGNEKDTSRPRVSSERFLLSFNSDLILSRPSELSSVAATDSDNCDMILEANKEVMDLTPLEQDFTRGNDHKASQFAPCDGPPANFPHPQGQMPSTLRAQILPKNHISSESSLRWRRSPILPATHLGIGKLHETAVSEDQLFSTMIDTPEILKEDTLPTNAVKLSSPNKKRVSPPRGRLLPLGSSSLTGLRTCRRFVLKAIQPNRPRTPCIQSQSNPDQGPVNSQSSSSSK